MLPVLNLDASAPIAFGAIIAIVLGIGSLNEGREINLKDSKYVREGVRIEAEVIQNFEFPRVTESRPRNRPASKSVSTAHMITAAFKLPDGMTVSKTIEVDDWIEQALSRKPPSVRVTYLPVDPINSVQVEGYWDYDTGNGPAKVKNGLWWLAGGLAALGFVCYRKRAAFKSLLGGEP